LSITSIESNNSIVEKLKIDFAEAIPEQKIIYLSVDGLTECVGTEISGLTYIFGIGRKATTEDLFLNEVLFNPKGGGSDFVEIFNASTHIIKSDNLQLARIENGEITQKPLPEMILLPNTYYALCDHPEWLLENYDVPYPIQVINMSIPSFPNTQANVTLLYKEDTNHIVIDSFRYNRDWHSVWLNDDEGVSLEKVHPTLNSNQSESWKSTSSNAGYATPTGQNSQYLDPFAKTSKNISIANQNFSPDGDGYKDFLRLDYNFDENNLLSKLQIFNLRGYPVYNSSRNSVFGSNGFFTWDGKSSDGNRLPIGVYILLLELINESGQIEVVKKSCVISGDIR
jgi:hypothetical protein